MITSWLSASAPLDRTPSIPARLLVHHLVCPLTGDMFVDPVLMPNGVTCERAAVVKAMYVYRVLAQAA